MTCILCGLLVVLALSISRNTSSLYALLEVADPDLSTPLKINFILSGQTSIQNCEATNREALRIAFAHCPQCTPKQNQCVSNLDKTQRATLAAATIAAPTSPIPHGIVSQSHLDVNIRRNKRIAHEKAARSNNILARQSALFIKSAPFPRNHSREKFLRVASMRPQPNAFDENAPTASNVA